MGSQGPKPVYGLLSPALTWGGNGVGITSFRFFKRSWEAKFLSDILRFKHCSDCCDTLCWPNRTHLGSGSLVHDA